MSEQTQSPAPRSRRGISAAANLLLGGGAGHIASGRYQRGLAWFAADGAAFLVAVASVWCVRPIGLWIGLLAFVGFRIASVVDILRLGPASLPTWGRVLALWLGMIAASRAGAFAVRAKLVEAFEIPAGSMIPTILVGDHLYVDKRVREPARGDVVVFRYPKNPEKDYLKRVVALGGDTVEMRDGALFVNGQPVPRRRIEGDCRYPDVDDEGKGTERTCEAWEESLGEHRYTIIHDAGRAGMRSFPATKVPPGQFFVLGDNRDNSHDSRFWGGVPLDHLKGRALFLWFSKGPNGIRWDRIDRVVH